MRLGDFPNTVQPLRRRWPVRSADGRREFRRPGLRLRVLCCLSAARLRARLPGGAVRRVQLTQPPAPLTAECGSSNHTQVTPENAILDGLDLGKESGRDRKPPRRAAYLIIVTSLRPVLPASLEAPSSS